MMQALPWWAHSVITTCVGVLFYVVGLRRGYRLGKADARDSDVPMPKRPSIPPPDSDAWQGPMAPQPPKTIQPILFADGYRLTDINLFERGLGPIVDSAGRIVFIYRANDENGVSKITPEEYCGTGHGARIS